MRVFGPGICRGIPYRKSDDTSRTRRVSAISVIALLLFTRPPLFLPKRTAGVKRLTRHVGPF